MIMEKYKAKISDSYIKVNVGLQSKRRETNKSILCLHEHTACRQFADYRIEKEDKQNWVVLLSTRNRDQT